MNDLSVMLRPQLNRKPPPVYQRILVYHGVDRKGEKKLNGRFISQKELELHFRWLAEHCFVASLEEYCQGRFAKDRPTVLITFDDGYLNNLELMLPVAQKYNLPVTVFVTTLYRTGQSLQWADLIDLTAFLDGQDIDLQGQIFKLNRKRQYRSTSTGQELKAFCKRSETSVIQALYETLSKRTTFQTDAQWDVYWKQLSPKGLQQLGMSPLVTIGNHGDTHAILNKIPIEEASQELKVSKIYLENLLQQPITAIAYPNGNYSPMLIQAARQLGYHHQFGADIVSSTVEQKWGIYPRLTINPYISWYNQRLAFADGGY